MDELETGGMIQPQTENENKNWRALRQAASATKYNTQDIQSIKDQL